MVKVAASLESERFDRIQPRRLSCRVVAEEHPDCGRTTERKDDGVPGYVCRPLKHVRNRPRTEHSETGPNRTANQAQNHGLDEELPKHVSSARTDGLPQPYLPSTFRNGHEHDVHDANA